MLHKIKRLRILNSQAVSFLRFSLILSFYILECFDLSFETFR